MPVVARELDALQGYTWAFSAFLVTSLFSMVAGGLWSDATGPRGPLIAGVAAFSAGAIVAGVANGLPVLVVGRAVQGLGGGAVIVGIYVLIARAYDVDLRPKAFSLLAASWVLPALVGPFVAGWLAESVSWRAVFLLVPLFVVPPAVLLFPRLGQFAGGTPHGAIRARLVAAGFATAGLFALQDGVLRLSLLGLVEALGGLVVLLVAARRLLPPGALRFARGLPTSVMMRGLLAAAYFSAEVFVPLALVDIRGLSVTAAGLVLSSAALMWVTGSFTQSRLPGDQDRSSAVRTGAAVVTLCLVTLPLAVLTSLPPWVAAVSWAVGAFGMGLSVPSVSVQVMRLSPDAEQGVNGAAIQIVDSVMVVVGISLLSLGHAAAVASGGATASTYTALWLGSAVFAVVAVVLAGRMRPSLPA